MKGAIPMSNQDEKKPPKDQVDDSTEIDDTVGKGDDGEKPKRADAQMSMSVTPINTRPDADNQNADKRRE